MNIWRILLYALIAPAAILIFILAWPILFVTFIEEKIGYDTDFWGHMLACLCAELTWLIVFAWLIPSFG